ncbi:hypothetical protein [Actinokineospora sp. NBRC 105648]|uniref:hypothetical protein n=1 Tax=Actinokineospora sp. NBRC 105648 TaxID=3032206 RepID=UPI002557AF14|nr:hypothetical protein [Actinokineospora sp. NBRC 105648]
MAITEIMSRAGAAVGALALAAGSAAVLWLTWGWALTQAGYDGEGGTLTVAECVVSTYDNQELNTCTGVFTPAGRELSTGRVTLQTADELYPEGAKVPVQRDGDQVRQPSGTKAVFMVGLVLLPALALGLSALYLGGVALGLLDFEGKQVGIIALGTVGGGFPVLLVVTLFAAIWNSLS